MIMFFFLENDKGSREFKCKKELSDEGGHISGFLYLRVIRKWP
jgi:hypothetical protein